ncbi:MAG: hypothetical protein IH600_05635 [Bacteroidetes bacterium]|nr:hypothetical protein [Bacteroidota bacterium]
MQIIKKLLPVFIGVAIGYAYWYFIGCLSGTCPITSNWYTSVLYGGVVGATWLIPARKKTAPTPEAQDQNTTES